MRLLIFLLGLTCFTPSLWANNEVWLLIDTKNDLLKVKQGGETLEVFNNIATGRGGVGVKRRVGDDVTPVGHYKISWINRKSKYHIFYGFDYPSIDNAKRGLNTGMINKVTYNSIVSAHHNNSRPPQYTRLGGQVGIHGLGKGSEKIHFMTNWTHGCVALTNKQIDRLDRWIEKGMVVEIR